MNVVGNIYVPKSPFGSAGHRFISEMALQQDMGDRLSKELPNTPCRHSW